MSVRSRRESRRQFLTAAGAVVALPVLAAPALGVTRRATKLSDYPFQLGVASGDPSPRGVVLWTRLAPDATNGGGMPQENVEVSWQVARDEAMTQVVKSGAVVATPQDAHSVHVEVDGLEPDRWYFYQFRAAGETSPKGRTRTMPPADSMPERLRFSFASCQHFESGYYSAYEHMIADELDLIVHLGDYIYEGAARKGGVREHVGGELYKLDDYRNRYAQYRGDEDLQAAHAACPWLVTWDDHEFDNNCAGDVSEEEGVDVKAFLRRRAEAYKAYYEHMPLRVKQMPKAHNMRLYRRVPFGRLAEFAVLDTRQYRTDQPNDDGLKELSDAVFDPKATLLGERQEKWLQNTLGKSPAVWNILAQQVMMARADRVAGEKRGFSMDQWSGYHAARQRLLNFLHERKIANPVVLTGDIHTNWVNDLQLDFARPDSPVAATEFVGTSITSGGNGTAKPDYLDTLLAENPFVKFHSRDRGYVRCSVSKDEWRSDYQAIEDVSQRHTPQVTRASFIVENGRPGAQPA
ncbi:MAG: alkaline phosphatase D family protein [Pirellulaceae bacterium]